jgi:O-antigen ligase
VWKSFPLVQIAALAVNTLLPLLALFVANQIEDVRWLKAITWTLLGLGAFAVVSFLFKLPTAAAISNGSRGLFATWVGVLAYSQLLFNRDLNRLQRIFLLALFLAIVYQYFIVSVTWFSGWVPLAIACAAATMMHSRRLTAIVAALLAVYLAVSASFYFKDLVQTKVASGDLERLSIWNQGLGLVARHPVLGMGPAGYAVYNVSYFPRDARSTHNNYFDILAQSGIAGSVALVWLLAAFIRTGAASRRQLRDRPGFELAFASAAFAGSCGVVVSMMLGDWVLPFAYNQTISGFDNAALTWIMLGAMVSLRLQQTGARRSSESQSVPWVTP